MQLTLPLTDAPIQTVTAAESRSRSRSAKRDGYAIVNSYQLQLVLDVVAAAGSDGVTRHEIADRLSIPLSSVCGRVNELLNVARALIYVAEQRRSGRSVLVYRG